MSDRKTIQLAIAYDARGRNSIVALCDDGSMWAHISGDADSTWHALPDVPQPDSAEEAEAYDWMHGRRDAELEKRLDINSRLPPRP